MSHHDSLPRLRHTGTPVMQILVGVLVSIYAILTMQMAAFVAWIGLSGNRAFTEGGELYDTEGRRITGWSALWYQYGALGWAVLALALLIGIACMWRAIGSRRTPAGWFLLAAVGAVATMFWMLSTSRFQF